MRSDQFVDTVVQPQITVQLLTVSLHGDRDVTEIRVLLGLQHQTLRGRKLEVYHMEGQVFTIVK